MRIETIDLFCGIGGLSYGFKMEGFEVLAGIDLDGSCKYAYETNVQAEFLHEDVADLTGRRLERLFTSRKNSYRVLIGCAPCTPYSLYTSRYRKGRQRDEQWGLLEDFGRLIGETQPDVVSMENVPRLMRYEVFNRFVGTLKTEGYAVSFQKVRADHYGVPQRRARLVLIASRWGEVRLPVPTHRGRPVTVRGAIGKLPEIEAGKPCPGDRLHVTRGLSDRNLARLKATKEGGSWKDWSAALQLPCHKKVSGKSFRSVYGRMRWDAPSPVITTQCLGIGNGRFGHPEQDRAISIREAALLQTFPKKFRFVAPKEPVYGLWLARQIGNAVPVLLGRVIARAIRDHLCEVSAGVRART
jgi:DNA (cytosine-5)-methyltransferase 1